MEKQTNKHTHKPQWIQTCLTHTRKNKLAPDLRETETEWERDCWKPVLKMHSIILIRLLFVCTWWHVYYNTSLVNAWGMNNSLSIARDWKWDGFILHNFVVFLLFWGAFCCCCCLFASPALTIHTKTPNPMFSNSKLVNELKKLNHPPSQMA